MKILFCFEANFNDQQLFELYSSSRRLPLYTKFVFMNKLTGNILPKCRKRFALCLIFEANLMYVDRVYPSERNTQCLLICIHIISLLMDRIAIIYH
jgi:arginyl-tRNA--protein-N-Asp/Glu arginylyltransferase